MTVIDMKAPVNSPDYLISLSEALNGAWVGLSSIEPGLKLCTKKEAQSPSYIISTGFPFGPTQSPHFRVFCFFFLTKTIALPRHSSSPLWRSVTVFSKRRRLVELRPVTAVSELTAQPTHSVHVPGIPHVRRPQLFCNETILFPSQRNKTLVSLR